MGVTRLPSRDPHAGHDELLIAAFAADDVSDAERIAAEALVRDCPACATLAADLRSIRAATSVLPAPVRTRDFRLTPDDAARLRPRGWRRVVAALGSPGFPLGRPLALTFTTLGLAGLLLATVPGIGTFGTATLLPESAPNERTVAGASDRQAGGVPGPDAPSAAASQGAPAPGGSPVPASAYAVPAYGASSAAPGSPLVPAPTTGSGASVQPDQGAGSEANAGSAPPTSAGGATKDSAAGAPPAASPTPTSPAGPSPWVVGVSIALLAAGLSLFLARWLAARAGPRSPSGR